MAMGQALLLFAGLAAIFALVPLCTLLATGSWRATWEATRGYATVWGIIVALAAAGFLMFSIGAILTP
jgi:hypothetical protein